MDTARTVWESFTSGSLLVQKRKEKIKREKQEEDRKEKAEQIKLK
jgi:hypothetical protein